MAKGLCLIFRAVICREDRTDLEPKFARSDCVLICVRASSGTDLFVLVGGDSNKLGFGERLAADHLLDASDLHNVYPWLIFVQRIQHDLWGD